MLGCGRPFVMTLKNPKLGKPRDKSGQILSIEVVMDEVNQASLPLGVKVLGLQFHSTGLVGAACREIHLIGEEKRKDYACICYSVDRDISENEIQQFNECYSRQDRLEIFQNTPIRVSHRRTVAVR